MKLISAFTPAATLVFLLFSIYSKSQVLQITDFAVFGGNGTCPSGAGQTPPSPPGCAVQIGVGSVINGNVGSYGIVNANGNVTVNGAIHSGKRVTMANSVSVSGRITAANSELLGTTILQTGNDAQLGGNLDINGSINVNTSVGSTVSGTVTHPALTTYSGPVPGGGEVIGAPVLPTLPAMPPITTFAPFGFTDITATQTIVPGAYKDMILGNTGGTITFSGPGNYVFRSIQIAQGPAKTFIFDLQGTGSGKINIYVHSDANLGPLQVQFINGAGNEDRVYWETHGTGSENPSPGTFAFLIGEGADMYGQVWAPYAAIKIGAGGCCTQHQGTLWSGTQVDVDHGTTITHLPCQSKLTIVKTLQGRVPASNWQFTSNIPGFASFSLPAAGGSITFSGLASGNYQITEVTKPGYTVSTSCGGTGSTASVSLGACDSTGCEFLNVCKGKITIRKVLQGIVPSAPWQFTSDIPGHSSFSLPATGGEITFPEIAGGIYSVTEVLKPGYRVSNSCGQLNQAVIALPDCDSAACEFLNVCKGNITIKIGVSGTAPATDWQFTSNIPGHASFTLPAAGGEVTFTGIPGGNYQVTQLPKPEYTASNNCGSGNIANINLPQCDSAACHFTNRKQNGCSWCRKSAILSQVWQNMCGDTCATPDIIVDLRLGTTAIDVSKLGTGEPATGSLQAAINYIIANGNVNGDCGLFIGVIATDCDTVPSQCSATGSRPPASDNFYSSANITITNTRPERLNIFGCNVGLQAANSSLPVITIQNSVGKVTVLDINVKGSTVAGYLVKNNADLVVVKTASATNNKLGYDVQDDNVEISDAPLISNNDTGIVVKGGPNNILRGNNSIVSNTGAGIRISGSGNESVGNVVGASGKPNGTGFIVSGNSNNIHDDFISYNAGDGIQISGRNNTIKGEQVTYNGARGIRVSGKFNLFDANRMVKFNTGDGFYVSDTSNNFTGNEAGNNGGHGFNADQSNGASANTFRTNAANNNGLQGIRACGQIDNGSNSGSGNGIDPQVVFNCIPVANAKFTVVDITTDKAYKYDASFNLISSAALNSLNSDANDATANGTSSYVLDRVDKQVYRYVSSYAASRVLRTPGGVILGSPTGIAIDGDQLWVSDETNRKLYRYSLSAAFTGTGTLNALQEISFSGNNTNARGLVIDATNLYVLDDVDKQMYRYPRAGGTGTASKILRDPAGSSLGSPSGAALDGTTLWIVDISKDRAYGYNFSLLFGTGNINASTQFVLFSANANATGIEVGNSSNLLRPSNPDNTASGTSSSADISNMMLSVFPQPSSGRFSVQFTSETAGRYSISIADMSGKVVMTYDQLNASIGRNLTEIDAGSLPKGMYSIIVETRQERETKKIVLK